MKFSNFEKIRESNLVDYEYKYKRNIDASQLY